MKRLAYRTNRHCERLRGEAEVGAKQSPGRLFRRASLCSALFAMMILFSVFAIHAAPSKNSIQIKGSDTMVNLVQAWAEEFMQKNPGKIVAVTGGGSGTGFASLINGTCDIAMASRTIKQKEIGLAAKKGIVPNEVKVALDGLAVVAHPANKVDRLTIAQLSDIFTGKVKNWIDAGGDDKRIVLLSREVNSGTHVYFKEHVLRRGNEKGAEEFSPDALLLPSSQAIADEIAQNPSAIGYYGMGYISAKQKVLSVAFDEKYGFIAPTEDNVVSGNYPISRPLFLYVAGQPEGLNKEFVDFVLSAEGQKVVTEIDFVPVKK